jgi:hypothetical protein
MKFFFFFLFGAIKFVLAEGGSTCGCGRVYVKEERYLSHHTSPGPETIRKVDSELLGS